MVSRTGDLYVVLSVEPELAYPFTMASIIRRISVDAASVPKLRLLFGRRYYVVGFRCGRRPLRRGRDVAGDRVSTHLSGPGRHIGLPRWIGPCRRPSSRLL